MMCTPSRCGGHSNERWRSCLLLLVPRILVRQPALPRAILSYMHECLDQGPPYLAPQRHFVAAAVDTDGDTQALTVLRIFDGAHLYPNTAYSMVFILFQTTCQEWC